MKHNRFGFTIVELLIVIVVIGILAAISIVAYNGISNQANDSAVKNDLANNAKKLEMFRTTVADGLYPVVPNVMTGSDRLKFSKSSYRTAESSAVYCHDNGRTTFTLWAVSKSGKYFTVSNNSPVSETSYGPGTPNMCPSNRAWIHNLGITTPDNWANWVD